MLLANVSTRKGFRATVVLPGRIAIDAGPDGRSFLPDMRTRYATVAVCHQSVEEAIRNIDGVPEATLVGHGLIGRINTGQGGGFFPADPSTHIGLDNDKRWEARIGEMEARSLQHLMLFSCGTGANDDGARLLFKLAKALHTTVCAPTGDVWLDVEAGEPAIVETATWQVADWSMSEPPPSKDHATVPVVPLLPSSMMFVAWNGVHVPVPVGAVQRMQFAVRSPHGMEVSERALSGNEAVEFMRECRLNAPFLFGGPPATLVTGQLEVTVGLAGREITSEFFVHDNRLLESVATPGEFYQISGRDLLVV